MITPMFSHICAVLEQQIQPSLLGLVRGEYQRRSGKLPTDSREQELAHRCLDAMRQELERNYDLAVDPRQAQTAAVVTLKTKLVQELDLEFPSPIVV